MKDAVQALIEQLPSKFPYHWTTTDFMKESNYVVIDREVVIGDVAEFIVTYTAVFYTDIPLVFEASGDTYVWKANDISGNRYVSSCDLDRTATPIDPTSFFLSRNHHPEEWALLEDVMRMQSL